MPSQSELYQRIWKTVQDIPAGCVCTYGEVARIAGLPRRARMVGQALRHTPDDLDLPWHRVINAAGRSSFPPGSDGFVEQLAKLRDEGIIISGERINLKRYAWSPSLDELLWKQ